MYKIIKSLAVISAFCFALGAVPLIGHAQTSVGGVTVVPGGQWTTGPGTPGTTNIRITYTGTVIITNNTGGPVTVNIVNLGGWSGYFDAWGTNQTTVQPGQTTYMQASKTIEVSKNVVQNSGPAQGHSGGTFSSLGNPEIGNGISYASPDILGSLDTAGKQSVGFQPDQN